MTNYLSFLNYAIETFNIILPYSTYTKLYIKKKIFARNNKIGDKVSRTICQDLVSNNISPELSRFDVKSYLDCYWLFTDFHWLFDRFSQDFLGFSPKLQEIFIKDLLYLDQEGEELREIV